MSFVSVASHPATVPLTEMLYETAEWQILFEFLLFFLSLYSELLAGGNATLLCPDMINHVNTTHSSCLPVCYCVGVSVALQRISFPTDNADCQTYSE
jgi:hypothetical protein